MVEKTDDKNQITPKIVVTLIIVSLAIFYLFIAIGIAVILVIFFVIWLVNKLRRNQEDWGKK
jgi:heme/copper-type cytochrome/quinol oxidase subunit 2